MAGREGVWGHLVGGDILPQTWRQWHSNRERQTELLLWVLAIGVSVADSVLTLVGLQLSLREGNPAMVAALSMFGAPGIVLVKGLALLWVALVWVALSDRNANIALALFVFVTGAVVFNNTIQILIAWHPPVLFVV